MSNISDNSTGRAKVAAGKRDILRTVPSHKVKMFAFTPYLAGNVILDIAVAEGPPFDSYASNRRIYARFGNMEEHLKYSPLSIHQ